MDTRPRPKEKQFSTEPDFHARRRERMRHLVSLFVCLLSVAVLGRWQAGRPEPFEMQLKIIIYHQYTLVLKVWETPAGADYHVQLPEGLGGGSGHLSAAELQQFRLDLETHHAWTLPSQATSEDRVILILHQGERSCRVISSARENKPLGEWLLAPKGLVQKCL